MAVKHTFVSAKADSADPTIVNASNWNANHTIDPATVTKAMIVDVANQRLFGRNTAGAGVVEEVTASQLLDWVSNTNGVLLTRTAGTWSAAANVTIDNGDLVVAENAAPVTPAASKVKIGARLNARSMPSWVDANGIASDVQPHIGRKHIGRWVPTGGATTTPLADGLVAPTATGTPTARNPATTNLCTSLRRLGYVSGAVGGNVGGARNTGAFFYRGDAAGRGGFYAVFKFAISDAVLVGTANMFVGMQAATGAPTDVAPSTLVNLLGVGCDNGDTVLQLYAAGAAAQSRTSLGANFPVNTISTDVYELILYCMPNGSDVKYFVRRCNTGDLASGTISAGAALPSSTTLLTQQLWRSNGGAASAVGIDLVTHYIETEE